MNEIRWQLGDIDSIDAFHDLARTSLEFPHYYGRNQDAFWDCLNEIVGPIVIRVSGWEASPQDLKAKMRPYLDMCKEYEEKTGGAFKLMVE